jgi:hypothetical protein
MTRTNKDIVIGLWKSFSMRDEVQIRNHLAEDAAWRAPADNATVKFSRCAKWHQSRQRFC